MVTRHDFSLDYVQASLFIPNHADFSSGKVVGIMLQNFAAKFDGEMQVLPIPMGMPPEIPRVILQSADGKKRFNAAPSRIDFVIARSSQPTIDSLAECAHECAEVLAFFSEKGPSEGNRLAIILNRFVESESPAQILISRFCNVESQEGPFNRSSTFEIHNHKDYRPEGLDYNVNSWVRCSCGTNEQSGKPALVVMQDINTIPNDPRAFDSQRIQAFFPTAAVAADEIFNRYFPG